MRAKEYKPLSVVPMLDGTFAVIERVISRDAYTAIYTAIRFESEHAAEAWAKDQRAGKAEEAPRPRETFEAGHCGPPFDDFWQDISSLAYMLDGESAEARREGIAGFLKHTPWPEFDARGYSITFEGFRRAGVLALLDVLLDGPLETANQEYVNRVFAAAIGVKTFAEVKAEIDDDDDKNGGAGKPDPLQ